MRAFRLALLPLLLVPLSVRAAEPSLEERLKALEERVRALEEENARLKAEAPPKPEVAAGGGDEGGPPRPGQVDRLAPPDIAPKPDAPAVVRAAGREETLKIGGLLQVQGEAGDWVDRRWTGGEDRFLARRARVNVSGRFREDFEWRTEVELAGGGLGGGGLRTQLTDGYVDWKRFKVLGVRAGQFKTPYGFEQLWPDGKLATSERTLGSDRLTLGRQLGVQVGGAAQEDRFGWHVGIFQGVALSTSTNDDERFLLAARLTGVPATWSVGGREARWTIGGGGYHSEDASVSLGPEFLLGAGGPSPATDFAGERTGLALDTQVTAGRFGWWAEWLGTRFRPDTGLPADELEASALMTQATWMFPGDRLQVAARWDRFDPDSAPDADWRTWTAALQWFLKGDDLKLQANWMNVSGPDPFDSGNRLIVRFQVQY